MTAAVDVLAVLSRADDVLISTGREDLHALADELREVGSAVAELIAAATEAFDAPDVMWTIASSSESLADRLVAAIAAATGVQP